MRKILMTLALGVALGVPAAADAGWVALVTSVHGAAHSGSAPLHVLSRLEAGQAIEVPAGASVTLSFLHGGRRVTLRGAASTRVRADGTGLDDPRGAVTVAAQYPATLMPTGHDVDRIGGVSSNSMVVPSEGRRSEAPPSEGAPAPAPVPPGAVAPGSRVAAAVSDRHLHDVEAAALDAWHRHPGDPTPFALMVSVFEEEGAYSQALQALSTLPPTVPRDYVAALRAGVQQDMVVRRGRAR